MHVALSPRLGQASGVQHPSRPSVAATPPTLPPLGPSGWLRAGLFSLQMYVVMALMGVVLLPWAAVDRAGALAGIQTYCRYVRWSLRWMVGLRTEVRGPVPQGEVIVAAKHQSFLDIIVLSSVLPRPRFVMKRELVRAPVLGWYALRIGCVPVDRGAKRQAVSAMLEGLAEGPGGGGQIVIYPQGTRVAPGRAAPYKSGTAAIYADTGLACVPAATNAGLFWPRRGLARRPGLAVVEFLDEIPPGLPAEAMMARLESAVEAASDRLVAEAQG